MWKNCIQTQKEIDVVKYLDSLHTYNKIWYYIFETNDRGRDNMDIYPSRIKLG
jgi:hypothetical protein